MNNGSRRFAARPVTVVLIEDSAVIRRRVLELLQDLDSVRVLGQAGDARSGLELIHCLRPDMVILDLGLPDRSGLSVLQEVRALNPGPRVVVFSNQDSEPYRRRCRQLGAADFVGKMAEFPRLRELFGTAGLAA